MFSRSLAHHSAFFEIWKQWHSKKNQTFITEKNIGEYKYQKINIYLHNPRPRMLYPPVAISRPCYKPTDLRYRPLNGDG